MGEIRDPIYGFITPTKAEFKIINTRIFQRLRKIKQLAMANLVYPGANHTRFDHSLGVFHVASMMSDRLLSSSSIENRKEDEERKRLVRLAALLHDVGHGPFSHISEAALETFSQDSDTSQEKIHERITADIIETSKELDFGSGERKSIIGLLQGTKKEFTLMKEIISGPLDADKIDYLLRDSYFCGVKYGLFDLHRMLNTLRSLDEGKDKILAITHDGINVLEQFALAKYYMTRQVYRHRVRAITDAMITRGIELGIEEDNNPVLNELYHYKKSEKYLRNYMKWSDEKLLDAIVSGEKNTRAKKLFARLVERNLFKQVFEKNLEQLSPSFKNPAFTDTLIEIGSRNNRKLKKRIEKEISKLLKCPPQYVILNSLKISSVREMSRNSEGGITVIDREGQKSTFEDESTVFRSIDESMKDISIEVYAPFEFADQRDKENKLSYLKKEITNILTDWKYKP